MGVYIEEVPSTPPSEDPLSQQMNPVSLSRESSPSWVPQTPFTLPALNQPDSYGQVRLLLSFNFNSS